MRINKLSIASFGRINSGEYELKNGLNVIYGPNESGKSTILSFIRFMLFGCQGRRSVNNITFEEKNTIMIEVTNYIQEKYILRWIETITDKVLRENGIN